jgi:CRISPR-associated protein Csd1
MILQELHQLHERLEDDPAYALAPPGYSLQKISFCVVLHPDGRLHAIEDRRIDGRPRQVMVPGTTKTSGSGLNPCFLWDNTAYMLGFKPGDPKPRRTRESFAAFRRRHLAAEQEIGAPAFSAVCRFLESWSPEQAVQHPVLGQVATGFGLFQIIGQTAYVHQDPAIDAWWRERHTATTGAAPLGQCLLTGETAPIARLVPMIKGVSGGKAEMALVGFNNPAYESYGKSQSFNAPISEEAARRWTAALNALLDGPMRHKHRFILGDATAVFWTDRPSITEDIFARFAILGDLAASGDADAEAQDQGTLKKLAVFVQGLREGIEKCPGLAEERTARFCLLLLSANAARVVVRRFLHGSVAELHDGLRRHYRDMGIERPHGAGARRPDPEFPSLWLLERQTARETKDIPPLLHAPLFDAVVTGAAYPAVLYTAVLRRIRADKIVNYPRACMIKGFLIRNHHEEIPMSLDTTRKDPAYRAGRLFAVLETTQRDALGDIGANIRDRFYGTASATPRTVFPRLMRLYAHHLAKLPPGRRIAREKLVQEIVDGLDDFPAHLGLAEQGLFAIGYYHQRNALFRPGQSGRTDETGN